MQAPVKMVICAAFDRFRNHRNFWSLLINIVTLTGWRPERWPTRCPLPIAALSSQHGHQRRFRQRQVRWPQGSDSFTLCTGPCGTQELKASGKRRTALPGRALS